MGLILKTTFKNIFAKPFRTLLVVVSIFICAFAAVFCFDLGGSMKGIILNMYSGMMGDADIMISGGNPDLTRLPEDFPAYDTITINAFTDSVYTDIPGEYAFVTMKDVKIYGVDMEEASAMNLIDMYDLGDNEAIITTAAAEAYGCEEGDVITVHDNAGDPVDLTVVNIIPTDTFTFFFRGATLVVNLNTSDILSCGKEASHYFLLDITDDSEANAAVEILKTTFPNSSVDSSVLDEGTEAQLDQILGFMFLLFAVAFLLVVFITASISNRIVSERMSFIGTLRSLGMSSLGTGLVLVLENVIYAIIGAIPGVWVFTLIRPGLLSSLFTVQNEDGTKITDFPVPELSVFLVSAVIIGAILVECLIPLKAQLKALKTSIRDIIFDNRDTEYKFSKFATGLGIFFAVAAVITFFMREDLFAAGACLISAVTAAALLFPWVLKWVTDFIAGRAYKAENERWALAARESGTRKSSVSSGTLCVTSAAMCIIIVCLATSIISLFTANVYDCDVKVDLISQPKYFTFVEHMDGVTDTEYLYCKLDYMQIEGENLISQAYGFPEGGFRMYNGLNNLPESMEDGTILVEQFWANRNGYGIGDEITITFDPNGVFPIERTFTIADFFMIDKSQSMKNNFVITQSDYISIFHDFPGMLLIRSDNPEQTAQMIETYAVGKINSSQTIAEYLEETGAQGKAVISALYVLIIAAIAMTFIGIASNQLIGFEGRKKECAVMVSTSMNKKTLSGVLFREMFITSAVSATLGAVLGTSLLSVIKTAVMNSDVVYMEFTVDPKFVIGLWVVMTLVFALSVLFPIRNLRKMKLSEQLKYE